MFDHWPWYVLVMAIINWVAVVKQWKIVEYIAKPGTMLLLLLWMYLNVGLGGSLICFTIGVIFSLAGDVFLMLDEKYFIPGLLSFLLAQVSYVVGMNSSPPYISWQGVLFLLGITAYVIWLYRQLAAALLARGKSALRLPVLIYALVISLMVYSALMTGWRDGWTGLPAILVSVGAVLFYASDSMLAWRRFVHPHAQSRLREMAAYHLGQLGIIMGAVAWALTR